MAAKKEENILFLRLIKEQRDLLFGKFKNKDAADDYAAKKQGWNEIFDKCSNAGVSWAAGRTGDWCRDRKWPSIRATTIVREAYLPIIFSVLVLVEVRIHQQEKRDKALKRTGAEGGVEAKYTEVDNLVFHILGEKSAVVQGLPVAESGEAEVLPPPLKRKPLITSKSNQ